MHAESQRDLSSEFAASQLRALPDTHYTLTEEGSAAAAAASS
jgi:hypothetical protein